MTDIVEVTGAARVLSPCTGVCRLDPATRWCLGCGRTGDEIARWTAVGDPERQVILDALPPRMAHLAVSSASKPRPL